MKFEHIQTARAAANRLDGLKSDLASITETEKIGIDRPTYFIVEKDGGPAFVAIRDILIEKLKTDIIATELELRVLGVEI